VKRGNGDQKREDLRDSWYRRDPLGGAQEEVKGRTGHGESLLEWSSTENVGKGWGK